MEHQQGTPTLLTEQSSSSERFSQNGNIITSKRQNLDPTTSKKLTHKSQLVKKKIKGKLLIDKERKAMDRKIAEQEVQEKEPSPKKHVAASKPKSAKRRESSGQGSPISD